MKQLTALKHIIDCVELQKEMNNRVNPNWINEGWDFLLAARMEAAEAIDHYGWKWWKKQEPNIDQCKIELVDIFHFLLSDMIIYAGDDSEEFSEMLYELSLNAVHDNKYKFVDAMVCLMQTQETVYTSSFMGVEAYSNPFTWLFGAARYIDFDIEDFFKMYKAKNILNIFRQDNGYKEGTYIKEWDGLEDNDFLLSIYDNCQGRRDLIEKELENKYLEVKNNSK